MRILRLAGFLAAASLLAVGCDDDTNNQNTMDMGTPGAPTMLLEDVSTTLQVPQGDGGVQEVSVHALVTQVVNSDPALKHDYDDRPSPLSPGCFADHYDLTKGDLPASDIDMGTVTITGYSKDLKSLTGQTVPDVIECKLDATSRYACEYQSGGGDPATVFLPDMLNPTAPITMGATIRFAYTGAGAMGTYDSGTNLKTAETLTATDDLTAIEYDPNNADGKVLQYTCLDKDCAGSGVITMVLVQLMATSVPHTDTDNYPGSQFGVANCVAFPSAAGKITVSQGAIQAMLGGSQKKEVMTRIVRGSVLFGQKDSKGNSVTVAAGSGQLGFAPIPIPQ